MMDIDRDDEDGVLSIEDSLVRLESLYNAKDEFLKEEFLKRMEPTIRYALCRVEDSETELEFQTFAMMNVAAHLCGRRVHVGLTSGLNMLGIVFLSEPNEDLPEADLESALYLLQHIQSRIYPAFCDQPYRRFYQMNRRADPLLVAVVAHVVALEASDWNEVVATTKHIVHSSTHMVADSVRVGLAIYGLQRLYNKERLEGLSLLILLESLSEKFSIGILACAMGLSTYVASMYIANVVLLCDTSEDPGFAANLDALSVFLRETCSTSEDVAYSYIEHIKRSHLVKPTSSEADPHRRLSILSPDVILETHLMFFIARNELSAARRLALSIEQCSLVKMTTKLDAWGRILNHLRNIGMVFLDGNHSTPSYERKLHDLTILVMSMSDPFGLDILCNFFHDMVAEASQSDDVSEEEKTYISLASQRTLLLLLRNRYGNDERAVKEWLKVFPSLSYFGGNEIEGAEEFLQRQNHIPQSLLSDGFVDLNSYRNRAFLRRERARVEALAAEEIARVVVQDSEKVSCIEAKSESVVIDISDDDDVVEVIDDDQEDEEDYDDDETEEFDIKDSEDNDQDHKQVERMTSNAAESVGSLDANHYAFNDSNDLAVGRHEAESIDAKCVSGHQPELNILLEGKVDGKSGSYEDRDSNPRDFGSNDNIDDEEMKDDESRTSFDQARERVARGEAVKASPAISHEPMELDEYPSGAEEDESEEPEAHIVEIVDEDEVEEDETKSEALEQHFWTLDDEAREVNVEPLDFDIDGRRSKQHTSANKEPLTGGLVRRQKRIQDEILEEGYEPDTAGGDISHAEMQARLDNGYEPDIGSQVDDQEDAGFKEMWHDKGMSEADSRSDHEFKTNVAPHRNTSNTESRDHLERGYESDSGSRLDDNEDLRREEIRRLREERQAQARLEQGYEPDTAGGDISHAEIQDRLEKGYEPDTNAVLTEEEVSETVLSEEDEEEDNMVMETVRESEIETETKFAPQKPILDRSGTLSDDMDAADDLTEIDQGAELSEIEGSMSNTVETSEPITHPMREASSTLMAFAFKAQDRAGDEDEELATDIHRSTSNYVSSTTLFMKSPPDKVSDSSVKAASVAGLLSTSRPVDNGKSATEDEAESPDAKIVEVDVLRRLSGDATSCTAPLEKRFSTVVHLSASEMSDDVCEEVVADEKSHGNGDVHCAPKQGAQIVCDLLPTIYDEGGGALVEGREVDLIKVGYEVPHESTVRVGGESKKGAEQCRTEAVSIPFGTPVTGERGDAPTNCDDEINAKSQVAAISSESLPLGPMEVADDAGTHFPGSKVESSEEEIPETNVEILDKKIDLMSMPVGDIETRQCGDEFGIDIKLQDGFEAWCQSTVNDVEERNKKEQADQFDSTIAERAKTLVENAQSYCRQPEDEGVPIPQVHNGHPNQLKKHGETQSNETGEDDSVDALRNQSQGEQLLEEEENEDMGVPFPQEITLISEKSDDTREAELKINASDRDLVLEEVEVEIQIAARREVHDEGIKDETVSDDSRIVSSRGSLPQSYTAPTKTSDVDVERENVGNNKPFQGMKDVDDAPKKFDVDDLRNVTVPNEPKIGSKLSRIRIETCAAMISNIDQGGIKATARNRKPLQGKGEDVPPVAPTKVHVEDLEGRRLSLRELRATKVSNIDGEAAKATTRNRKPVQGKKEGAPTNVTVEDPKVSSPSLPRRETRAATKFSDIDEEEEANARSKNRKLLKGKKNEATHVSVKVQVQGKNLKGMVVSDSRMVQGCDTPPPRRETRASKMSDLKNEKTKGKTRSRKSLKEEQEEIDVSRKKSFLGEDLINEEKSDSDGGQSNRVKTRARKSRQKEDEESSLAPRKRLRRENVDASAAPDVQAVVNDSVRIQPTGPDSTNQTNASQEEAIVFRGSFPRVRSAYSKQEKSSKELKRLTDAPPQSIERNLRKRNSVGTESDSDVSDAKKRSERVPKRSRLTSIEEEDKESETKDRKSSVKRIAAIVKADEFVDEDDKDLSNTQRRVTRAIHQAAKEVVSVSPSGKRRTKVTAPSKEAMPILSRTTRSSSRKNDDSGTRRSTRLRKPTNTGQKSR